MAEIKVRFDKNGKPRYTASIRIKGHPSLSKTFGRLTDAKEWASSMESKIKEDINFPKRKLQKLTMNDIIDKFIELELPKKKKKAQSEFRRSLNWYKEEIGHLYIRNVTSAVLIECREKLAKKPKEIPTTKKEKVYSEEVISPATVNRYLECISVVFNFAKIDLDILDINPMEKVKKMTEDNKRKRCLELKEISKLLNACQDTSYELYLCVLISLLTGARKGEVLKLTWADVDLEHNMIYFMKTKNGEDRGTPMHELLTNELQKYKNQSKVRRLKNDYLFPTKDGKPKESLIGKLFPKIVKRIGITDFRFHDLRHTHASWQAMEGISQQITQKTLGHKSPQMTDRYSHLRNESIRPALNSVGDKMLEEWTKEQTTSG